jgi:hypothetical protein
VLAGAAWERERDGAIGDFAREGRVGGLDWCTGWVIARSPNMADAWESFAAKMARERLYVAVGSVFWRLFPFFY